ncbi:MAG: hypothetical protein ABIA76_04830 [Candidatus Diapherotrites archaeon]
MLKSVFVQYKFILPEKTKHSAYSYQKLFRAIYGYTQNVTKSSGKTHRYFRRGILTNTPYIRPGKNCVILPQGTLTALTDFFQTGKNPTHYWREKGNWKAVYYRDEKNISEEQAAEALEQLLDRVHIAETDIESNLEKELAVIATEKKIPDATYLKIILEEAKKVVSSPWFQDSYKKSDRLVAFYSNFIKIKK